jgi:hypothetical protein
MPTVLGNGPKKAQGKADANTPPDKGDSSGVCDRAQSQDPRHEL